MPPKTERFEMRLDATLMNRIDQWRQENGGVSRAEAVRDLILHGLDRSSRHSVHFSDGEKLIIAMIAELQEDPKERGIDTSKIMQAIYGGHYWSLHWEMHGLFHDHVDDPGIVSLVADILDMWEFIELAVENFSKEERAKLIDTLGSAGENPQFGGFDGNHETEHMGIARQFIERMDRFQRFKGRSLNSHRPVVPGYASMLRVFQPMRSNLGLRGPQGLSAEEVIKLLQNDL